MPANLNALIRYKTINNCLYGGRRKWSIDELINACSEALAETRGRYNPIAERTIRDDIRVMRSDILGFNAPLKEEKGLYFYSDQGYSIMNLSLSDTKIIDRIIILLTDLRTDVKHPELEILLEKLSGFANIEYKKPVKEKEPGKIETVKKTIFEPHPEIEFERTSDHIEPKRKKKEIYKPMEEPRILFRRSYNPTWKDIFNLFAGN